MLMMTCNRSRVGKKQELQSRALNLIKNNSDTKDCKVANSIRDIYNRRYPPRQAGAIDPTVITTLNAPGIRQLVNTIETILHSIWQQYHSNHTITTN